MADSEVAAKEGTPTLRGLLKIHLPEGISSFNNAISKSVGPDKMIFEGGRRLLELTLMAIERDEKRRAALEELAKASFKIGPLLSHEISCLESCRCGKAEFLKAVSNLRALTPATEEGTE